MRRLGLVLGMLLCLLGVSVTGQAQPNPLQGPQSITVQDAGACATAGACASFSLNNFTVGTLEVSGTFTGTLTPEVLVNSVWVAVTLYDGTGAPFTTVTAPGAFSVANTGLARVRFRAGAFASGTATVFLRQGYFMAKLPGGGARVLLPNGSATAPSLAFAAAPTSFGLYRSSNNGLTLTTTSGTKTFTWDADTSVSRVGNFVSLGWSATTDSTAAADTGLSRTAVGQVGFGNGTPGDITGTFSAAAGSISSNLAMGTTARIFWSGRAQITSPSDGNFVINNNALTIGSELKADALPTATSCGTSPAVTAGSTPLAGSVNVGTGGTASACTVVFGGTAYPSAPFCLVTNGTASTVTTLTAVGSATTLNINSSAAWPANSVVTWHCISAK